MAKRPLADSVAGVVSPANVDPDPPARVGGRFPEGVSGNPAGRALGSKNKITQASRDLLDGAADDLIKLLIAQAKEGQRFAMRLVIDRIVPVKRERRVDLGKLPQLSTAADLLDASAHVIGLAGDGEITLDEALSFVKLLAHQRGAIDAADLHSRVEVLESEILREREVRR